MSYHLVPADTDTCAFSHSKGFFGAFSTDNLGFCRFSVLRDFSHLHLLSGRVRFVTPSVNLQAILGVQTTYFQQLTVQK